MKLVSVNIEGQKHLDKIRELLVKEKADIVCLAECFPDTINYLAGQTYPFRLYVPTYQVDQIEGEGALGLIPSTTRVWGEAILSKYPLTNTQITYLSMEAYGADNIPIHGTDNHIPALIVASIKILDEEIRLGTVHLTWTPKARVTKRQRQNVTELIELLSGQEVILAGDFNLPRGNDVYTEMTKHFKDNIPQAVMTTLDPELHYTNKGQVKKLQLVVDYIFSTPKYEVKNVRMVEGVSDHCAIVCNVGKL